MKIGGVGNLCLWCMEEMGENLCCPYCGHDERVPLRAEQAIPAGQIIGGHYLIGRPLGQGGFGITYLAYDLDLHIKRAIKEYFPQGLVTRVGNTVQVTRQSVLEVYQKGVDSFYREAQSIARFGGHPNVVQVHAFFRENNSAYFVMDYVEGISFKQYLEDRGGRISWQEALRILKPIGEALTALHDAHLLHRDVKPDNIFITRTGTPKLLDFGAARYETSESSHISTPVLTPGYAPVEQYGLQLSRQGTYTDVYALSATFYRAVSGVVPIPAPDRMTEDPLVPLDKLDGRVPAQIGTALSHGMGVRSEKRTQTVAQLLKELDTPVKEHKLPKWLLPALAAVVLVALGLLLGMSMQKPDSGENPSEVVSETVDNAGTAEALALTLTKVMALEIPTNTPEPTADKTKEFSSLLDTAIAETAAARPTDTPVSTSTPEPTETEVLPLVPVAGLKAVVSGQNIQLTWNAYADAESYEVYRAAAGDSEFRAVGSSNGTFYGFIDLSVGETYSFKVRAKLPHDMYSDFSEVVSAVISAPMATNTQEPTKTPTQTSTNTPSPTATNTPTPTATKTPTPTSTPKPMATRTQTPTSTPKPTATRTPTSTNTPVPMATATLRPTATATEKAQSVITDEIRNAQVGDHVYYGHYEQDNDLTNGAEAIEWRVLAREDNRLLLLSEYGLDAKPYNEEFVEITWEKCTLRSWLNGEFYQSAFSTKEQLQIATTIVRAEKNPKYVLVNSGYNTQDRIFLLNIQETIKYFKSDEDLQCKLTAYAVAQGASGNKELGTGWWWLRSPGSYSDSAADVSSDGSVNFGGYTVYHNDGFVRPSLWLNL